MGCRIGLTLAGSATPILLALYSSDVSENIFFDLLPANVFSMSVAVFIPSSDLSVSPINLIAVTYTLYSVYGVRLSRVYVPVKLKTSLAPTLLTACSDWSWPFSL